MELIEIRVTYFRVYFEEAFLENSNKILQFQATDPVDARIHNIMGINKGGNHNPHLPASGTLLLSTKFDLDPIDVNLHSIRD